MKNLNQQGFTLVEVLIATGIVVLTLVGISSGVTFAVKNTRFSQEKAISVRHAQESIEWFRSQRDILGWNAFYDLVTQAGTNQVEYCLDEFPEESAENIVFRTASQGCETIPDTQFTRSVRLTIVGTDQVEVESLVVWGDGSQEYQTSLSNSLRQWR